MIKIYENVIDSYIQNDESFCHVKQYAEYDKLRHSIVEEMAHLLMSCRANDCYIQAKIDEKERKCDA